MILASEQEAMQGAIPNSTLAIKTSQQATLFKIHSEVDITVD